MSRETNRLVWGSTLLLVGLFWLLHAAGLFALRGFAALVTSVLIGGTATLCWLAYRRDRRRWGFLICTGMLAPLALIWPGEILGVLPDGVNALLFFAGLGWAFFEVHRQVPDRLWSLLCVWICAVLGVTACVGSWGRFGDDLAGSLFLLGSAFPFAWYFLRSGRAWAILPAGILASAGVVSLLEMLGFRDRVQAPVLLAGLAVTFAAYAVLGRPGKSGWARWPAAVLAFSALLTAAMGMARVVLVYAIPIALIALGVRLILGAREDGAAGFPPAPPPPLAPPPGPDATPAAG